MSAQSVENDVMIQTTDVEKWFGSLHVLQGISVTIKKGEVVVIFGPSGSGKSTLMNILGLLDHAESGEYLLGGESISGLPAKRMAKLRNQKIGFVFQQFHLLPRTTAAENVELPLLYSSHSDADIRRKAREALCRVGLEERLTHYPSELSGGQQQRVAIARALVGKPSLILADEPTGALDTRVGAEIMELFKVLNRDEGIAVVIITHDPGIAEQCSRYVIMQDGILLEKEQQKTVQAA